MSDLSMFIAEEDERAYYLKSQAQRKQKFLKQRRKVRGQDKVWEDCYQSRA